MTLYTKHSAYFVDPEIKTMQGWRGKLVAFDHVQRCPEDRLELETRRACCC